MSANGVITSGCQVIAYDLPDSQHLVRRVVVALVQINTGSASKNTDCDIDQHDATLQLHPVADELRTVNK